MTEFKSLNIEPPKTGFVGDKMKITKVINRPIIIHKYRIVASNYEKGSGKRIDLQIEINNEKYITWCGSVNLMEMIKQVPETAFPLKTTIVDDNGRYLLT